ncbi:uncharacterized protein KY384_002101 [Bacidia gigantensis]|uniref:uncharacterized protein n=1 Tax=Bacidia gigantensis TaxID=2732470 RepID=UPI001D037956|nr:uncharacterized protein KY384_002101 [Bacidia gigantensis]KAG8533318.1 hypothetical protein KY384_002101 [Bacidia gigantensis]
MDFVQDYLPQLYYLYNTYNTTYHPYVAPIYRFVLLTQSYFFRYIFPTIYPLYTVANSALHTLSSDSPDLVTLLCLAVILIISMKALEYMRKTVIFWLSLILRLGLYALLLGVGVYVWQRGLDQSLEDFGFLWGLFEGLSEEGQKVGNRRAKGREWEARNVRAGSTRKRGGARGSGW